MDQGSGNIKLREPFDLLLRDNSRSVLIPDPYVHIVLVQSQVVLSTRIRDQSRLVIRIHIASVRLKSYKDLIATTEPSKTDPRSNHVTTERARP